MPVRQKRRQADQGAIARNSGIPYYVQLKRALTEQMESGRWISGDRLPSELELCRSYRVSRTVVRQALKELTYEGRIVRHKGRGTFVAEPKIRSRSLVHSLAGFYEDMLQRGMPPSDRLLERQMIPASHKLAVYLKLEELAPVHKITRLRFVHNEPVVLVTSYLPYEICRELARADLGEQSLYAFLQAECGLQLARGRRRIEATLADEYEAGLLQVGRGAPLLRMESISYLEDGTPVEYFQGLFRSDRTRFEVEILRGSDGGELSEARPLPDEDFWLT
jgi:GntR family transcriptional regulator